MPFTSNIKSATKETLSEGTHINGQEIQLSHMSFPSKTKSASKETQEEVQKNKMSPLPILKRTNPETKAAHSKVHKVHWDPKI